MESKSSFGLSLLQNYSDNDEDSNCESSICQNGIAADHENAAKISEQIESSNCLINATLGVKPVKENDEGFQIEQEFQATDLSDEMPKPTDHHSYRETCKIDDSSDSESSSDESSIAFPQVGLNVSVEEEDEEANRKNAAMNSKCKMLEDLGIFELAHLEDLKISVPEEECIPIGVVHNIIDPLVIVSAMKGCPAIDLDSVLFLDHGKTILGQVFDVFGQVSEPMYMVRFNSLQHIIDKGVRVGMEVFFAPRTRHTAYVFVDSLFKQKGSDASWEFDQEPPEGCLDYSDDEQERRAKTAHRLKKNHRNDSEDGSGNPCKKRQAKFRRPKGHNSMQQQAPVNPFYMVPPPCYPPCYPPPANLNPLNVEHPPIPPTPSSLTTGQMANAFSSPYIYPPPPLGTPMQNHPSQPADYAQNLPSQSSDVTTQNPPVEQCVNSIQSQPPSGIE